jgi:phage shock protein C
MADRLYRSRDDRMIAGVAGGLAEMWDADPALIRIIWALLVIFTGGVALLVYIVMAIVVPEADDAFPASSQSPSTTPGDAATPSGSGWVSPGPSSRDARAEARAARRAARAERFGTSGGAILGGFLVLLGLFFLAREYLPNIDFDWFWPLLLVALGVVLLVSALGRGPRSGGST